MTLVQGRKVNMIVGCDIDGVLADVSDYHHILPDWDEFYKHTLELPVIPEMAELVGDLLRTGNVVVFITGRPSSIRRATTLWLKRNIPNLHHVEIKMRQDGDFRPSINLKLEALRELRPSIMIEDEPKAVEAIRAEGFTVLQVHGYRVTMEDLIPYTGGRNDIKTT